MNAFSVAAATLLSRYLENLLKEESEEALSGKVIGDETLTSNLVDTITALVDSFEEDDYHIQGIYRTSGSLIAQTNALNIIEHARGEQLKLFYIYDLLPDDKANCIKNLLRKMPDTVFPHCQRAAFLDLSNVVSMSDQNAKSPRVLKALQILVYFIPEVHKRCLKKILEHLKKISAHSNTNKMDIHNLSLMFCSYIFPVTLEGVSAEQAKEEILKFGQLFPVLIKNSDEIFFLSDEMITTLDSTLQKQYSDKSVDRNRIYMITPEQDDPEIVLSEVCAARSTPTRSTTDMEVAKLMAEVYQMSEGPRKKMLLKKMKTEQRQKLGIQKSSIFKKVFTSTKH